MAGLRHEPIERTLAGIESRVLDDIWLGPGRVAAQGFLTLMLAVSATMWWFNTIGGHSSHGLNRVPSITIFVLFAAAVVSAFALRLQRFRGVCAAAYAGGLAAVIGIGAFWWLRTGRPGASLGWLTIADIAAVLLTAGWMLVIVTPIERSQPEMRASQLR
ncbi:hypothetical protein QN239_29530 [Mycolicibacterium sp. Y3]